MQELDDDTLLYIFSKLGNDSREIAKLATVCKQWRDLCWSVSCLSFSFAVATKKELMMKEDIISSVLCRTRKQAPGNLKYLSVTLLCSEKAEATCHWLIWATGLDKLDINGSKSLTWGPALWITVLSMDTIKTLQIVRSFHSIVLPHVVTLKNLRYCIFGSSISVSLLHAMFATCPALERLAVGFVYRCKDFSMSTTIRVTSASLTKFQLIGVAEPFKMILDAPNLKCLILGSKNEKSAWPKLSIQFVSKRLCQLYLYMPCVLSNRCDSVKILKVFGEWESEELANVFKLTRMVSELHLRFTLSSTTKVRIDDVLAPLMYLRNIHLGSSVMTYLEGGVMNLAALDAHLWPDEASNDYDMRLLRELLDVHKIRSLLVHCKNLMDHRTKTVKQSYTKCRDLFDLLLFYPDRAKLCPTVSSLVPTATTKRRRLS